MVAPRAAVLFRWAKAHRLDLAFGISGTAMGWLSLCFPFGRDQGLYFYVAREWVERGAIPYRDVLDHKTPGIYVLHALAIWLFGANMWGIRILDLIGVLLVGLVACTFTVKRDEKIVDGVCGATILATNIMFFGFLDFWNTEQSELWYSLLGLAAIWAARRVHDDARSAFVAGTLSASAIIMKPPAIWFVAVALACVIARVWKNENRTRQVLAQVVRFGGAFGVVSSLTLGYFAAHGALHDLFDIVVGANAYYVQHETSIHTLRDVLAQCWEFLHFYNPVGSALLVAVVALLGHAVGRGDRTVRDRLLFTCGLLAAAFLAVAMQKKFYLLHWIVFIGPAAVVCAHLAERAVALVPRLRVYAFVGALIALYAISDGAVAYRAETAITLRYLTGNVSRAEFARSFELPAVEFHYGDSESVGLWLRDHSSANDFIAVRGFEPEIYAVADRRYPGRFFWTTFITSPVRAYKRAEWLAEDSDALARNPPRYVVTLSEIHEGPDSSEYFYTRGYIERVRINALTILEHAPR
jgi:4-amino-4-deoxy-L-arabinose transferase-like glycosyltransferase